MTTVNGTSSSTATTGTTPTLPSASTSATGSTQLDSNTFLKLLVAQLKYQDPSSPSDATQFLSETAQFSVVQKLDALSALDQKVLDASKAQTAAALIGKQVTYTDVAGKSHTGTVTGTTLGQETPTSRSTGRSSPWTPQRRRHRRLRRTAARARADRLPTAPAGTTPAVHHGTDAAHPRSQENLVLRSLFSGITRSASAPDAHGRGRNNISNVNTTGYKSSSVVFEDTLSQMVRPASVTGRTALGGVNPEQVGLGVQLGAISTNFAPGLGRRTPAASTDLMIQGDGFFVLQNGHEPGVQPGRVVHLRQHRHPRQPRGLPRPGLDGDNGVLNTNATPGDISVPTSTLIPPKESTDGGARRQHPPNADQRPTRSSRSGRPCTTAPASPTR